MPNPDSPDFSFLNESSEPTRKGPEADPASDSDNDPSSGEAAESDAPAEGGPAWMDHADSSQTQDSGTRFAAALAGGTPPSDVPDLQSDDSPAGEETVPMEDDDAVEAEAEAEPAAAEAENAAAAEEESSEAPDTPEESEEVAEQPAPKADPVAMAAAAASAAISTPGSVGPESSDETGTAAAEPKAAAPARKKGRKPSKKKSGSGSGQDSSSLQSVILISYASAVTLICLYLLYQSYAGKPHELESLPDLKPPMKNDEIAYRLVPEGAELPPGHTLRIGDSRRYGNLKVTPIRVERKPLEFKHYTGDPMKKRDVTSPVLKLWLRFENVSSDQTFAPLDRKLLLTRIVDPKEPEYLRSNQFIAPKSEKGNLDESILLYDLEMHGNWNFAGIPEDLTLGPGESCEVYIPSREINAEELEEPLVWRIQFRKGYHPKSYRGVTTLIEVRIDPDSIQSA